MNNPFDINRIEELAYKMDQGTLTDAELAEFNQWYNSFSDQELEISEADLKNPLMIRDRMHEALLQRVRGNQSKMLSLWPRIITVAAAIAIVISGLYFYNRNADVKPAVETVYVNDIAPGKVGATLTLASGQKINLADAANGELAREDGISVSKTADGQLVYTVKEGSGEKNKINTLTTAKGETYILTLPDRSKVWMNAASSLTYATALNEHGERRVKLSGEAYFQIAKDKVHPFIVESRGQQLRVLGTHFNINSYADEPVVRTTLLEGSVKVSPAGSSWSGGETATLKPGQEAALDENGKIKIQTVDTDLAVAWKDNQFMFESAGIERIMKMVERWYDVEVVFAGEIPQEKFGGAVSRFDNISKVIKVLEATKKVHFKIEGRKVIVTK